MTDHTTAQEGAEIDLDLDRLEALARAATPGDWLMHETCACNGELSGCRIVAEDGYELIGEDTGPGAKDAEFIAAANPAAVLALIKLARQHQGNGEPVGEAGTMPGTAGFTMACFKAADVPIGTKLYTAPAQAQHAEEALKGDVMQVDGLPPCPFCGGGAELQTTKFGRPVMKWVRCTSCEASATAYQTAEHAYSAWSQRRAPAAQQADSGAQAAIGYITDDAVAMLKAGRGSPVSVAMRSTGPWHVPIYLAAQSQGAQAAELGIGFANNDQGVHVNVMQRRGDGTIIVLHQGRVPAGDSFTRFALAAKAEAPAADELTDDDKRLVTRGMERWHKGIAGECRLPPVGWHCTRGDGHEGPCATHRAKPEYGPNNPPRLQRQGESVEDYRTAMGWAKPDERGQQAVSPGALADNLRRTLNNIKDATRLADVRSLANLGLGFLDVAPSAPGTPEAPKGGA